MVKARCPWEKPDEGPGVVWSRVQDVRDWQVPETGLSGGWGWGALLPLDPVWLVLSPCPQMWAVWLPTCQMLWGSALCFPRFSVESGLTRRHLEASDVLLRSPGCSRRPPHRCMVGLWCVM